MGEIATERIIEKINELQQICQDQYLLVIPFAEKIEPIFNFLFSIQNLPGSVEEKLAGALSNFEEIGKRKQMASGELEEYRSRISSYLYDAKNIVENPIRM